MCLGLARALCIHEQSPNTELSCEAPSWLGFVCFNSLFCGVVDLRPSIMVITVVAAQQHRVAHLEGRPGD
jgi:hypothetical protein